MKKIFVTMVLAIFVNTGIAQEVLKLNLEKSIEIALENNHDLKIADYDKQIADEQIREAFGSAVLPEINGLVDYRRAIKRGEIIIETEFFSGSFPQGTENTMDIGLRLEQPLFTGAVFYATRIANVYADISTQGYYGTKAALIRDVKRAYYAYILSREFLDLSKITLKAAEDNLRDSEAMYKAGVAPEYDFIRAKVQVQNIIPEVENAANAIKLAANTLKLIMGLNLNQQIEVTDSINYRTLPLADYEDLSRKLDESNFRLKQLKLQIELNDKVASYEYSKHFPELYLNGSYLYSAQENDDKSFSKWRYINSFYIGLNLKVPIFNGWQTTSRVQQAEIELEKAKEQFDRTDMFLKNELEDIRLTIDETKKRIDAYLQTIEQAQLGYDIAQKRYSSGVGTQLENIDALVELTRAKVNYLNAIFDYYVLHAQLEELIASQVQVEKN